jgi:hypothetical protein
MLDYWVNEINCQTRYCGACHFHSNQKQMNGLNPQTRKSNRPLQMMKQIARVYSAALLPVHTPFSTLNAARTTVPWLTNVILLLVADVSPNRTFGGRACFNNELETRKRVLVATVLFKQQSVSTKHNWDKYLRVDIALRGQARSLGLQTTKQSNYGWNHRGIVVGSQVDIINKTKNRSGTFWPPESLPWTVATECICVFRMVNCDCSHKQH